MTFRWAGLLANARADLGPMRLADDSMGKTAVAPRGSRTPAAEATYGHISTWETGGVTDMSYLFCGMTNVAWGNAAEFLQRGHRRVGHLRRHDDGLHFLLPPRPSTRTSARGTPLAS